jgi:hypothetical protein
MRENPVRQWLAPPSTRLIRMKVTLETVRPTVWRRLLVPAGFTLRRLHRALVDTMGWNDSHLHQFIIRGNYYGKTDREFGFARRDERLHNLQYLLVLGVCSFRYEYDFGDRWMHRIAIEKVEEADGQPLKPLCLAGKRACPPEDSGGARGYAELLDALSDPSHPDHEGLKIWAGPRFDPERFDIDRVNRLLAMIR